METKISIIVPIYNAEKYLEKCLDSLKNQTFREIEVLMIDDGSTDSSPEICKGFAEKDPRFVHIRQDNAGVSAARNKGLEAAHGEYIGFCDSDDFAEPDMYEDLYRLVTENGADVAVVSSVQSEDPPDRSLDGEAVQAFSGREAIRVMHHGELFQGQLWNKIVRRDVIGDLRLDPSVAIFEDMLFLWDLFARCEKVVYQKLQRYHYIYNPDSALYGSFRESFRSVRTASLKMLEKMEERFPSDRHYAEKTLLLGDYVLAEKLAATGRLTKEEYAALRPDFDRLYTDDVKALFSDYHKKKIGMLLRGRTVFLLYTSLRKLYRRIRR